MITLNFYDQESKSGSWHAERVQFETESEANEYGQSFANRRGHQINAYEPGDRETWGSWTGDVVTNS